MSHPGDVVSVARMGMLRCTVNRTRIEGPSSANQDWNRKRRNAIGDDLELAQAGLLSARNIKLAETVVIEATAMLLGLCVRL
jgi:hypothetical protein